MNMDTRRLRPAATALLLLLCAAGAAAQQPAPDATGALESLRAAVRNLRAVDRDPNIPEEIRAFNREVLLEKEAQLRPLLETRRRQWRDYLSGRAGELSEEQIRRVGERAAEIDAELRQMIGGAQAASPPAGAPASPPAGAGARPPADRPADSSTAAPAGEPPADDTTASGASTQPAAAAGQTPSTPGAAAQPGSQVLDLNRELRRSAATIRTERARDPTSSAAGFFYGQHINLVLAALIPQKATAETVTEAENARTDKQIEGNEAKSGTTSLVSKGGIPAVLGFAAASGALTRSESGNTITFQLNPVGLVSALAQRGYISSFQNETAFERQLRNFALGFSFDTSRGDTGGLFTGSGQQLSGLSVRYNLINRRDPRDRSHQDRFIALAKNQGVPIARDTRRFLEETFNRTDRPAALDEWERKTDAAVRAAAPEDVMRVLEAQIRKFPVSDLSPRANAILESLARSLAGFQQAREELLERVASGLVMTLEYNLERRGDLPDLSNIRFIAEKGPYDGKIDLTFNSSLSFFHSRPAGANADRLRDFRFAGQLDVPLRETRWTGKPLLTFAGRYQRLVEDETLASGVVLSAKGDIAVGQIKLTIPVRGTAFKIPLSLSFANRTELIQEREVRGNFGFTFDLDSVFARFNPFKP